LHRKGLRREKVAEEPLLIFCRWLKTFFPFNNKDLWSIYVKAGYHIYILISIIMGRHF
jgi:hypothetical protein